MWRHSLPPRATKLYELVPGSLVLFLCPGPRVDMGFHVQQLSRAVGRKRHEWKLKIFYPNLSSQCGCWRYRRWWWWGFTTCGFHVAARFTIITALSDRYHHQLQSSHRGTEAPKLSLSSIPALWGSVAWTVSSLKYLA